MVFCWNQNRIEYKSNNLEENDGDEMEAINIKLYERKFDSENDKNVIGFDGRIYKEKTRKTLKRLTSLRFKKKHANEKIYLK